LKFLSLKQKEKIKTAPTSAQQQQVTDSPESRPSAYRRTQGCKRATEFYIKCIAARQFKCTYTFWKAGKMF
jgi:hypothetical protein